MNIACYHILVQKQNNEKKKNSWRMVVGMFCALGVEMNEFLGGNKWVWIGYANGCSNLTSGFAASANIAHSYELKLQYSSTNVVYFTEQNNHIYLLFITFTLSDFVWFSLLSQNMNITQQKATLSNFLYASSFPIPLSHPVVLSIVPRSLLFNS